MSAVFRVVRLVAAVVRFISPEGTLAALASVLGFLFLLVGVAWMVPAFRERAVNPLW